MKYTHKRVMSRKKTHKLGYSLFSNKISEVVRNNGGKDAFADKIFVSTETVRRWCSGVNLPDGEQLMRIREEYGVSIDWLLASEKPPSIQASEEPCFPQCGPRLRDLCEKVKDVMESETHWSDSLEANIKSFKKGLDNDRELEGIKRRLDHIEKTTSSGLDGGTSQSPADRTVASRKAG